LRNPTILLYGFSAVTPSLDHTETPMADAATAEVPVKPQLSAKEEVRARLDRLPDSVTLQDSPIASRW
jgi:hypothetical protein